MVCLNLRGLCQADNFSVDTEILDFIVDPDTIVASLTEQNITTVE